MRYRFDDCLLDMTGFQVWKADAVVTLEPKSIRVLHYLVEHRGRLVGKDELMRTVWGEAFVTDNALTRVIAQLRKALGDNAKQARYIETVPTQGYRFIAAVTEDAPQAVERPPRETAPVPFPRAAAGPKWWFAALGMIAVAGGAGAWYWSTRAAAKTPATASVWEQPSRQSIQFTNSAGLDASPAFSPDGNAVAYASDQGGGFEIYVRAVEPGAREVQVTRDGGQNVQPSWSADGKTIAYYSARKGGIYAVPAFGGFPRQLTSFGSEPKWSPDGKWIAFRGGGFVSLAPPDIVPQAGSHIWVISAEGGEARPLTASGNPEGIHASPSWTPDGSRVLFVSYTQKARLWTASLAGSVEALPETRRPLIGPLFAPDGKSIYSGCITDEAEFGICRIDPGSGSTVPLARAGMLPLRDLAISRDGTKLAYGVAAMSSNLWSLPVTTEGVPAGAALQLTQDTSMRNTLPAISPDGRGVAYLSRRKGIRADIFVRDASGATEQITKNPAADVMPAWTRDGKAIVFTSMREGGNQLWRISLDDGKETMLSASAKLNNLVRVSPDGAEALFHRMDGPELSIWRMALNSGEAKRITPVGVSMGYPNWSRDGKWIGVEITGRDGTQAAALPAAGGPVRALTRSRGQNWPYSWSPDSGKLAIASLRDGVWNLWWVGLDGREQRLTNYPSLRTYVRYPEWSPVGGRIVFELGEARGNIYVMSLN